MAHDHDHHDPHVHHDKFTFEFALSLILNLGFTFFEGFYALAANSSSLLADAGHNLSDILGLGMAWGAHWLLSRQPSERFSYGFRRTSILAALGNALFLVLTCAFILYGAVEKLIRPQPIHEITVIIVAAIGILINGGSALLFRKGHHHDLNLRSIYLHLAYDALTSLSVVITGFVILFTQWYRCDALVGFLIVAVILKGTWTLLRDSINLMLDAVPRDIHLPQVKRYLSELPGVKEVHDLHIWALSTREIALTAHLVMPQHAFTDAEHAKVLAYLNEHFSIHHVTLQVESGKEARECEQHCKM